MSTDSPSPVGLARRPVFDRSLGLSAYELVGDLREPEAAAGLVGNHRAWLRCTSPEVLEQLQTQIPPERTVVEIELAGAEDDAGREKVAQLRRRGYTIAADGHAEDALPALSKLANVAVLDLQQLEPHRATAIVARLKDSGISVAARSVDTPERYRAAHGLGFDLFRGDFFCRPQDPDEREPAPARITLIRLLAVLQDPHIELSALERVVLGDISLSYRLLRYINSAFFGLRHRVTSIGHAVRLLGLENVKRWSTVMLLAGVDHRPRELLTTALVRARFCELVGPRYQLHNPDRLFTLGLMSVIDALMNTSMARALRPLPLPDATIRALTLRRGPKGELLKCALAAERGELSATVKDPDDAAELSQVYCESVAWAERAQEAAL